LLLENPTNKDIQSYFASLDKVASKAGAPAIERYVDLGTHVVKLISYSEEFLEHAEKQLTWSLRDGSPQYDATLVIWKKDRDNNGEVAESLFGDPNTYGYRRLRLKKLTEKRIINRIKVCHEELRPRTALIDVDPLKGVISAWNPQTNTYYYALENLEPEEVIKLGHLFVSTFYQIVKGPSTSLVHGAAIGLNGNGAFFCGAGYRGKSTLSVGCMLDGFDYVSDDYLILSRDGAGLKAWPIYSIIALSSAMYRKMYSSLNGKFVSNNGRKDKYIFNIAAHHDRFRSKYPIKLCLYPHITSCDDPSVELGGDDVAIQEFAQSSLRNTGDIENENEFNRLTSLIGGLPIYRINLSPHLKKNTQCLRDFLVNFQATNSI
jgi:hypothetical protein